MRDRRAACYRLDYTSLAYGQRVVVVRLSLAGTPRTPRGLDVGSPGTCVSNRGLARYLLVARGGTRQSSLAFNVEALGIPWTHVVRGGAVTSTWNVTPVDETRFSIRGTGFVN